MGAGRIEQPLFFIYTSTLLRLRNLTQNKSQTSLVHWQRPQLISPISLPFLLYLVRGSRGWWGEHQCRNQEQLSGSQCPYLDDDVRQVSNFSELVLWSVTLSVLSYWASLCRNKIILVTMLCKYEYCYWNINFLKVLHLFNIRGVSKAGLYCLWCKHPLESGGDDSLLTDSKNLRIKSAEKDVWDHLVQSIHILENGRVEAKGGTRDLPKLTESGAS